MSRWVRRAVLLGAVFLFFPPLRPSGAWEFAPDQAQNVEIRGQVGGACRTLAFGEGRLLVGQGPRLVEMDIADPANPRPTRSFLFPSLVDDIALSGDFTYVLAGGLWILGLGEAPTSFCEVATLPVSGDRVFASGGVVYVTGGRPDIAVVDVRVPEDPREVGGLDLPHDPGEVLSPTQLVASGRYAYVAYERRGLDPGLPARGGYMLLDAADPKALYPVLDFRFGQPIYGLALQDGVLYLLADGRLYAVDVADPTVPKLIGEVEGPRFPHSVATSGAGFAYVTGNQSEVWVFALRAGEVPLLFSRLVTGGEALEAAAGGAAATVSPLFVADGWAGLTVFESRGASGFAKISRWIPLGDSYDVAVSRGRLYVADGESGLRIFDLSDPDNPAEVGSFPTMGPAVAVEVRDTVVFVAERKSGLEIVDVADPAHPLRLGAIATTGTALDVALVGDYALVAAGSEGLLVVRADDPARPSVFGRFRTAGPAVAVAASATRAFVCDGALAVWVVDISSPGFPRAVASFAAEGFPSGIAWDGRSLYVAETDRGLGIVGFDPRGRPLNVSRLHRAGGWFVGVCAAGNLAYVADAGFGLRIAAVSNPCRPSEAGFITVPGYPRNVAIGAERIYLAAGCAGLYVFHFHWSPDLAVHGFDFEPCDVSAGDEIRISGEILNESTTPTVAGAWVEICASPNYDFSEPRYLLCPRFRIEPGFAGLASVNLALRRFVVLSGIPDGAYRVGVVVDSENEVAEFREDNNVVWRPRKILYVGERPSGARAWVLYR